jgi:hypothetical protein
LLGAKGDNVKKQLTPEQWRFLLGIASLKIALAKKDALAIEKALAYCFPEPTAADVTPEWPAGTIKGGVEGAALLMSHAGAQADVSFILVRLLATSFAARALHRVRLVFWIYGPDPQLGPALYCPEFKTAVAVHLILRDAFRYCPRCQKTFLVEHPTQMCCSIECREAHRIARWRAAKRQENKQ